MRIRALFTLAVLFLSGAASAQQDRETPAEAWVREQRARGAPAELGAFCGGGPLPAPGDGNDPRWRDPCRILRAAFLRRLLLDPAGAASRLPFTVSGARITGLLDLRNTRIEGPVTLGGNRFEAAVDLGLARVGGHLILGGAAFEAGLSADALEVAGHVLLSGATVRGGPLVLSGLRAAGSLVLDGVAAAREVDARAVRLGAHFLARGARFADDVEAGNAVIEGVLNFSGSTIKGRLAAGGLRTGGNLLLRDARLAGPVSLLGASAGANVELVRSEVLDFLDANGLRAGGHALLKDSTFAAGAPLDLTGATVGANLELVNTVADREVRLDGARVGRSLFLSGAILREQLSLIATRVEEDVFAEDASFGGEVVLDRARVASSVEFPRSGFARPVTFLFSRIGGNLSLAGTFLSGLSLYGSEVAGEFNLGGEAGVPPVWAGDAGLILRNARVRVIRDAARMDGPARSWPDAVDLQGFTYASLGSAADRLGEPTGRGAAWFTAWLARDREFSQQSYQHLAGLLRAAGEADTAEDVLYAARLRREGQAWKGCAETWLSRDGEAGSCWEAARLLALRITIGHGIGERMFRVLFWVAGLTALGAAVLWFSPEARRRGAFWCAGASLDHLLPIVELNAEFGAFFNDPRRENLRGWQLAYFGGHALVGFLLGTFVLAGLSGITQGG